MVYVEKKNVGNDFEKEIVIKKTTRPITKKKKMLYQVTCLLRKVIGYIKRYDPWEQNRNKKYFNLANYR